MTQILILGATGMLGHKLCQVFSDQGHDVFATVRTNPSPQIQTALFAQTHLLQGVDVYNFDTAVQAIAMVRPQWIINCIGIIKQLDSAKDPIPSLMINSLLPHRLAALAHAAGCRMIHISTDCVFNGRKMGPYLESDPSDAEDLYGRSKFLGETTTPNSLTLRTSIIGREINTRYGLIEWFLSNRGKTVKGFRKAIYSGFTTPVLARIILDIIAHHPELQGVYQVSSDPIDKFTLLELVRDAFRANITIVPDDQVEINRSMDNSRFRAATNFTPPTWGVMIDELSADGTPYDVWRS